MANRVAVNNDIYDTLGERWYEASDDPVALLRAESRLTGRWVAETIQQQAGAENPQRILDVGCGGGFLSNRLSVLGHEVTGVDVSVESLEVARQYDTSKRVRYQEGNVYQLPFDDASFDVVCAMDFLEHVDDPSSAVAEMARVLRPEGLFFFHTFNRSRLAQFVAIKLVEWFVPNTPKNMHVPRLFIKPEELREYCHASSLEVVTIRGTRPDLTVKSVLSILRGAVPRDFSFSFTNALWLAYIGFARKRAD